MFSKYDVYTTVQSMYCYPDTDVLIPFAPDFMVLPMQDFIALRKETRFSN